MPPAFHFISKLLNKALHRTRAISYAQCGEDLIVNHLFNMLGISRPTYLDIGAHHPTYLSNTYYFYKRGCRGVCVEPDPHLFRNIERKRKGDTCLNVGVGSQLNSGDARDFFVMSCPTLNTFSKEEAQRYQSYGKQKIKKVISVPLISVNEILGDYFTTTPNFVSLDVEGLDFQIAESIDFNRFRPEVFCIETLSYTEDRTEVKLNNVIELMGRRQYVVYADTYINTIFVENRAWRMAHRWD